MNSREPSRQQYSPHSKLSKNETILAIVETAQLYPSSRTFIFSSAGAAKGLEWSEIKRRSQDICQFFALWVAPEY
jgi:hypothetical protein